MCVIGRIQVSVCLCVIGRIHVCVIGRIQVSVVSVCHW